METTEILEQPIKETNGLIAKPYSDITPDRFRRIGSRRRSQYNFCQEHYTPSPKAKALWRRLKHSKFSIGDESFPGFYSAFKPKRTNTAFWSTVVIEGSIALMLLILGSIYSGFGVIMIIPLITLVIDLLLATVKHGFDHQLTVFTNSLKVMRLTNVDFIGLKSKNLVDYNLGRRVSELRFKITLIRLYKAFMIGLLIFVANYRVGFFIEHLAAALTSWLSIPYVAIQVLGYTLVCITTLLHATLSGYFLWNYWFDKAIESELADVWENKYSSGLAIQWPVVVEIKLDFGERRSHYHGLETSFRDYDVVDTNHGIRVAEQDGKEKAFLITHGLLEDEHLKQLTNAVNSAEEKRALSCFLIKQCQLDRLDQTEVNNTTFQSYNHLPERIRVELLRRYKDYILYQDAGWLADSVLLNVKKIQDRGRLTEFFGRGHEGERIIELLT